MRAKRTAWALRALLERAHRRRRRDPGQRLDQLADLGAGQPEVAVAAVALDPQHPALDQPAEMGARGRRGDAGLVGQHARRQRAAVAEREQDPGPACDRRQSAPMLAMSASPCTGPHTVARRHFVPGRSVRPCHHGVTMSSGNHGFAASVGAAGTGAMRSLRGPDRTPPPLMDPTRKRDGRRILALFRPYRLRLDGRARADRDLGRRGDAQPVPAQAARSTSGSSSTTRRCSPRRCSGCWRSRSSPPRPACGRRTCRTRSASA